MIRQLALAVALAAGLAGPSAHAVEPAERLAEPALEARARALSQELRCLVCQNQSIDESNADLAHDLRVLLRQRLAGRTRYPLVLMLEPLFRCNLACTGCGKISACLIS